MTSIYDRLLEAIPTATFNPPATLQQITAVEHALGARFPDWLRDVYLRCNGIQPRVDGAVYLHPLERSEQLSDSLLSWNQFHRDQWLQHLPECTRNRPEVAWDSFDPHQLLIIGRDEDLEWAIRPELGPQIIEYDVRNPDSWDTIATDLVEACLQREQRIHETHELLFRGRDLYRGDSTESPASYDIDRLFDNLVAIRKAHDVPPGVQFRTGIWLHRAISKRPGEVGELFILPVGLRDEIRIATRDGNLPFIMRLTAWPFDSALSCVIWSLKDALAHILAAKDVVNIPWIDGQRPRPDELALRNIWHDVGSSDSELAGIADVLCLYDDRRRLEGNLLGNWASFSPRNS